MAEFHQIFKDYAEKHEEETIALLRALARIPAPSNHEEKRAVFCRDWLKEQGAEGVYIDGALNVIYPVNVREGQPFDVYMAHLDVVFPDTEELPLEEKDGRIYCPGIGDDTACVVSLLMAAKYIAAYQKAGEYNQPAAKQANRLVAEQGNSFAAKQANRLAAEQGNSFAAGQGNGMMLVLNTGEEGLGNLKGTKEIFRKYDGQIRSFCTFDSEIDSIVDRAVGSIRYEVEVRTEGGHSYNKFGNANAIEKLAGVIARLYRVPLPAEGKTTYNVGEISGGTSINTIAQYARMLYEYRSDRRENLDYMTEEFQKVIGKAQENGLDITYKEIGNRPCGAGGDPKRQRLLTEKAVRAVQNAAGITPEAHSGSTDCNIPLSLGIPAVCVGCYRGSGAHTRGEFIETDSVKIGVQIVLGMIFSA